MNPILKNPDAYSDPEEYLSEMKSRVIRYFCLLCFVLAVLSVPASFLAKDPSTRIINCIALLFYIVPVVIVSKTERYSLAAKWLLIIAMSATGANAIATNFSTALPTTIWYFVYIVFAYLVLNFTWMMVLISFTFCSTTLFTVLQLTHRNVINPLVDEHSMLIGTPVTLGVALLALIYLLTVYRQVRDVMFSRVLAANREKNQMVGVMSHDLRNYFSAIQGICSLITDTPPDKRTDSDFRQLDYNIGLIDQASQAALKLVEEVVAASRDSALKSLVLTVHDLGEFILPVFKRYEILARAKGVRFVYESGEEPVCAAIDKDTFSRMIENLLSNAYKFTKNNGTVTVRLEKAVHTVVITISDTGIGIPADLQSIIFTPFSKAGRAGTANEKTFGIGLSIVKKLVDLHGGNIVCTSEPGKGTTFTITLAAAHADS